MMTKLERLWLGVVAILGLCVSANFAVAQEVGTEITLPSSEYQKVSDLVPLPDFIPGMGTLYVQPATLPAGPFLAYDRGHRLVSTIYMIPLGDLQEHRDFSGLDAGGRKVVSTDVAYNAGHPGVETPHYHIVLWHVAPASASLR